MLILVAYLVLGTFYRVSIPLFEAPDKAWPYLCVKHYADGQGLPVYDEGTELRMRQKANQRPLFCVLNGMASS